MSTTTTTTSGNTNAGDGKGGGAREWIKNKLKALSQLLGKLANKQSIGIPTRSHMFNNFGDFEQSKGGGWLVISEFVGTHNRCWNFDLHIFYDENEKEINHLKIQHTIKTVVIPNIKAVFSSSFCIRFCFHHFDT